MPDDSDFLRSILADPEDGGPRLAYSDWLEESGDSARAEALRLGVALGPSRKFDSPDRDEGFDDVREATLTTPPLTTVRQPVNELGRTMARTLLARIDGEAMVPTTILPVELIRRESA